MKKLVTKNFVWHYLNKMFNQSHLNQYAYFSVCSENQIPAEFKKEMKKVNSSLYSTNSGAIFLLARMKLTEDGSKLALPAQEFKTKFVRFLNTNFAFNPDATDFSDDSVAIVELKKEGGEAKGEDEELTDADKVFLVYSCVDFVDK